jgi:predicted Zn-dependent protease with MMP-like domain
LRAAERQRFDDLVERVISNLPEPIRALIDEVPVLVEDYPDPKLIEELGMDPEEDDLCGLHTGVPRTERSHEDAHGWPETIHLFREGVIDQAGGWAAGDDAIREEIRITLLHEIGHHFGLEEDDLGELGYE